MTRSSRSGDVKFAIVPFLLLTVVVPPILAIALQTWIVPALIPSVVLLAWAVGFMAWRRIDVRGLVGAWPAARVLLRWCAINSVATLLVNGAVLLLAVSLPSGADLERSLSFDVASRDLTGVALLAACLRPFLDVLVMQGLVLRNLLERLGARGAVLASAVVAAVVHADPLFLMHFGGAIVLAVAYVETRSLWTVLVMEFAAFAVLLAVAGGVEGFATAAPVLATQVRHAWQSGPVACGVAALLMAWVALVAWVFARVPSQPRTGDAAPLAAA